MWVLMTVNSFKGNWFLFILIRNKKPVIINDENINTSNRISSSVRVATVKLYEEKKKPFKYLFEEKEAIFQKNDES